MNNFSNSLHRFKKSVYKKMSHEQINLFGANEVCLISTFQNHFMKF
jgi:hypothetical protein